MRMIFSIKVNNSDDAKLVNPFIKSLLRDIRSKIIKYSVISKYSVREDYIKDTLNIKMVSKIMPKLIANSIYIRPISDNYEYEIYVSKLNKKLYKLIKLLEFGDDKLRPLPLIRVIFEVYRSNISNYWNSYLVSKSKRFYISSDSKKLLEDYKRRVR